MIQFYLLSVVFNTLTALLLLRSTNKECNENVHILFFETNNFTLIVGVLTVFTGFMKLLLVVDSSVLIFADFLPACIGLLGGAVLLVDYYRAVSSVDVELHSFLEQITTHGRKHISIACFIITFLHFIVPQVVLI